jgi:hypothetical protein
MYIKNNFIPSGPAPWTKIMLDDCTQIHMGNLCVGMRVKTMHKYTLEWGNYEIVDVKIVRAERLKINFDHVELICSKNHKFYVNNFWKEAKNILKGSMINDHKVVSIKEEDIGEVVSIVVDNARTYVCEGMVSHDRPEGLVKNQQKNKMIEDYIDMICKKQKNI